LAGRCRLLHAMDRSGRARRTRTPGVEHAGGAGEGPAAARRGAGGIRGTGRARCAAAAMNIPRDFNAAAWFVDRHIAEGRAGRLAIRYEGRDLTYGDVLAGTNRCGNALRRLGVRMEQRVILLLPDGPEFVYAFWGALKLGAVPVPTNTLLKPRDYEYILNDSRAAVVIADEPHAATVDELRPRLPHLTHLVVAGRPAPGQLAYDELVCAESAELASAPTTRDDVAFWQYTSGTTGTP